MRAWTKIRTLKKLVRPISSTGYRCFLTLFGTEELQALQKRVRQAVSEHKLDITGYLASGLVFQPRATLTTSECISCLLETQPSLLSHVSSSDPEVWRSIVLKHLNMVSLHLLSEPIIGVCTPYKNAEFAS